MSKVDEDRVTEFLATRLASADKPTRSAQGPTLAQRVYDFVVQGIQSGTILPGSKLRQDHLARELGVSNIPVREAFARLEHHGLVERVPHRGTCAKQFSVERIHQLYQVRLMLEAGAVRDIADRIRTEQLQELEQIMDVMRKAHGANNVEEYLRADYQFHRALIGFTGNDALRELFEPLLVQINSYMAAMQITQTALSWSKGFDESDGMGHSSIYRALVVHDGVAAEKAIRANLENAGELVMRIMRAREMMLT